MTNQSPRVEYIPAQPGWDCIRPLYDGGIVDYLADSILAWQIQPDGEFIGETTVTPVTSRGVQPMTAIRSPDGQVYDPREGATYRSADQLLAEWQADTRQAA